MSQTVIARLDDAQTESLTALSSAKTPEAIEDVRVALFGRKGVFTAISKTMKDLQPEERPIVGKALKDFKATMQSALDDASLKISNSEDENPADSIDITLNLLPLNFANRSQLIKDLFFDRIT